MTWPIACWRKCASRCSPSSTRLAPAYLLRRRSGDLVALATQDVETVEYFYAHTVAPAFVAVLIPASVLALLAWVGLAARAGAAAVPRLGRSDAGLRTRRDRPARRPRTRCTGPARRASDGDDPGPAPSSPPSRQSGRRRAVLPRPISRPTRSSARRCWTICRARAPRWRSRPASAAWRSPCWARCSPRRAGLPTNGCRCWCWCRSRPSCRSRRSARWRASSPIPSPRPGDCMSSKSEPEPITDGDLPVPAKPRAAVRIGALHLSRPQRAGRWTG